jgi:molecular chaperone HscB
MPAGDDYFALFGLPEGFELDLAQLTERYRSLQRTVHPDNFASGSDRERLLAVQRAALINEAFETLNSPIRRAHYLLERLGRVRHGEHVTLKDPAFLMEQMELREELDEIKQEADAEQALSRFAARVQQDLEATVHEIALAFREGGDAALARAEHAVGKLQFFEKLQDEVTRLEDRLLGL